MPALVRAAFVALVLSAAPGFAGSNTAADPAGIDGAGVLARGDAARGAEAYVTACADCHRTPARFMARVPGDDAAARAAWLEAFLPDHYAPDEQARADIIVWLLTP